MKKTAKPSQSRGVWIFGDYRDYFRNRVTLQLIAKGKELAGKLQTEVTALVLGHHVYQYAMEYIAHGADEVILVDHLDLKTYQVETYGRVIARIVEHYRPEIFLGGATPFGRELFPRLAKRLGTGLSADCVALEANPESRLLVQTSPAWGGEMLADVITLERRPQMATVHPNIFVELPHNAAAIGRITYPEVEIMADSRIQLIRSRPKQDLKHSLEDAHVVVVGGYGMGSRENFRMLFDLAELLGGEVGATRPAVRAGWAGEDRLLGQTGKSVKPRLLITVGTSGALQYITGIHGAETIIAINRDPYAPIFKLADLGLVGDGPSTVRLMLEELRKRG